MHQGFMLSRQFGVVSRFVVLLAIACFATLTQAAKLSSANLYRPQSSTACSTASDLAARLEVLNPDKLRVTRVIFDGETHNSSVRASLGRAVYFVMPE